MRILHCSDLHLLPQLASVPLADWLSKRAIGALNFFWERQAQFALAPQKLDALAEFAREQSVDAVLCTGDFTLWGTDREHENARRAVQSLVAAAPIFVAVPGNHDIYTQSVVDEQRFERHFGDLLATDMPEAAVDGFWPSVRFLGEDAVVIAVNSSIPHWEPWKAGGRIPQRQLDELSRLLGDPRIRDRFVFVITHHAPILADGSIDPPNHGLGNAGSFLKICSEIEAGAILFGHVHHRYRLTLPGLNAELINSGSATLRGREGVSLIDVADGKMKVRAGMWAEDRYMLDEPA